MQNENIEESMSAEIRAKHIECQKEIEAAAQAVKAACKSAEYLGQLVEKSQRSKKHTVFAWLSETADVPGDVARAYRLAHTTGKKRNVASDRRALTLLGIIEAQVRNTPTPARVKPSELTLGTKIKRASETITRHLESRPVESMSRGEVQLLNSRLRPLAELWLKTQNR